jgi:tetratricopeptide (TPR) repeat protein
VAGNQAYDILRPVAEAANASVAARRAFVDILVRRGFEQQSDNQNEAAVLSEQQARQMATELGALDLSNIQMAALYADAGAWLVTALQNLGRNDEARRIGEESVALADKVLERRPGFRLALHAQQVIESTLSGVALNDLNPSESLRISLRNQQISLTLLNLDPKNLVSINNLGVTHQSLGDSLWFAGRFREAMPYYHQMFDDFVNAASGGAGPVILFSYQAEYLATQQSLLGDEAGATATLAKMTPLLAQLRQSEPKGSMAPVIVEAMQKSGTAQVAFERDDLKSARRVAWDTVDQLQAIKPERGIQEVQKYVSLYLAANIAGHA